MAIVDNAFREWIADFKATNPGVADSRAILDTAQYAFAAGRKAQRDIDAARQPVGEPVTDAGRSAAYDAIDRFLRNNMDDEAYAAYVEHLEALWAAIPAQAVDLGQFRPLARYVIEQAAGTRGDMHMLACQLQTLIDRKADGNG